SLWSPHEHTLLRAALPGHLLLSAERRPRGVLVGVGARHRPRGQPAVSRRAPAARDRAELGRARARIAHGMWGPCARSGAARASSPPPPRHGGPGSNEATDSIPFARCPLRPLHKLDRPNPPSAALPAADVPLACAALTSRGRPT